MPTCTFYWGDSPLSWLRWMTLCSFRIHNPEWGIRLLTSEIGTEKHWCETCIDQDQFSYHGEDWRGRLDELGVVIETFTPPVLTSANTIGDIARWDVLAKGGVYADMDIIFTRPFDEQALEVLSGNGLSCQDGYLYLGLTSSGGSQMFADIRDEAARLHNGNYQASGVHAAYRYAFGHNEMGLVYKLDTLKALSDKSGEAITNIPIQWVHPFTEPEDVWKREAQSCYGVHWYAGHRKGQEASNTYGPEHHPTPLGQLAHEAWAAYTRGHDG